METKISEFKDEFAFLSNFWPNTGITVEHKFQAAKTDDVWWKIQILHEENPGKAKRLGRKCPIVSDWEEIKTDVMLNLLREKFSNLELKEKLLSTGDLILEEGNTWNDTFWGICPPNSNNGLNTLGRLLMQVREELK